MAADLILRPYQEEIITRIQAAWSSGNRRVVCWLPTGGGKTELACKLAQLEMQAGGHTLFVVERKSLCSQGANRFRKYGMLTGILRAGDTFIRGYEPVAVGSVQTLRARHDTDVVRGVLDRTTLVIVDEAHILHRHHDELLKHLPDARVVGLTATPLRDGLGLRYDTLIRGPSYEWMIDQGFLVRPRYFMPAANRLQTALNGVSVKSTGDYQDDELSRVMRDKSLIGDIVGTWKAKAENRRTLVFCVDIAHSKDVCDEFNADGVSAEHLDYMTKDDDRLKIFERFRSGETRVLCSVVALSIGFDEPAAACVVLARPTLSLSLHIQQIGRGLRPVAGKSDCLIFDHALNVVRHDKIESFDPPELSKIDKRSDCRRRSDPIFDYRPCPECSAILAPAQRECHECGHVIKSVHAVDWQDGDLVECGAAVIPLHENRDFYRELLWIARQRGYKPGWPYFKYLERYPNHRPPYSWRDLTPILPTAETVRWLKSRQIAWRKAQGHEPYAGSYPPADRTFDDAVPF